MAVSYLSRVYESNPYILPVDLNLLAKVNSYKQGLFYQNANALRQQFSALKNSDILNPQQKAVLDEKYNNLSNSVNSWGGVDYSDMGITNQIEGMAASIYSDPTVLNGIASTKKIRGLMGNYEKMKTDPKLMKYYNKGNEAWDMQAVNDYVTGSKDATYTGATAPTIYKGNPYKILTEQLGKLKPNIEVRYNAVDGNPYYIEKTTNSQLSPERALAGMEGAVDADVMGQIRIDAWYNMQGLSDEKLTELYKKQHDQKVSNYNQQIEDYNEKAKTAPDKETKVKNEAEAAKIKNLIDQENAEYNPNNFAKSLATKEGKLNAQTGVYLNKLFDDAIKANSYQQVQSSLQVNVAQIQKDKWDLAVLQMQNARDIAMLRAKGSKTGKDIAGASEAVSDLLGLGSNFQKLEELESEETLSIEKINADNLVIDKEISELLNGYLLRNAGTKDDQGRTDYLGLGNEDKFKKRLGEIAILDNKEGLSINDIKSFLQNTSLKPTDREKKYFQQSIGLFEKAAQGDYTGLKSTTFSKSEFKNIYQQYADKLDKQDANNILLNESKAKAKEDFTASKPLSAAEKELVNKFLEDPKKYVQVKQSTSYNPKFGTTTSNYTQFTGNKQMENALKKAGINYGAKDSKNVFVDEGYQKSILKRQNEILSEDEFRQNYYSAFINYEKISKENPEVKSLVEGEIPEGVDLKTISVTKITQLPTTSKEYKAGTPWVLKVKYEKEDKFPSQDVYITNEQAGYFGLGKNTRMDLETALLYKGELSPRFASNDTWGDAGIFKYQVVRPGGKNGQIQVWVTGDLNTFRKRLEELDKAKANGIQIDEEYYKKMKQRVDNKNEIIKIRNWVFNEKIQPFTNGTLALEIMNTVFESAHTRFPDRGALLESFEKLESQ